MTHLYMFVAVVFETIGTAALLVSEQFTRPLPITVTVISYVASFYFLSLTLKTMPVGVAYAIWSCLAIVMISLAGAICFRQMLDAPAMIGIGLIVAGVATINLFSKTATHGG